MTITTEINTVSYDGDDATLIFPYLFKVIDGAHMRVFIDDIEYAPDDVLYPYTVTGINDNAGGTVDFTLTAPPTGNGNVTLLRDVPATQEIDYTPYDDFPAETHETGLDKLTMLVQQAINNVDNAIRIPITENAVQYNTILPTAAVRAGKFLFFDNLGNVSVVDADLAGPVVQALLVEGGHENRLRVNPADANFPEISTIVNQPNALVQLDAAGNVPLDHLNLAGQRVLGFYRGDDLCDKVGDNPGECLVPDYRNPSERFPELVPDPGENNASKFQGGDYYVVSMGGGELSGSINLFLEVGDVAPAPVVVAANDGIMFIRELTLEGTTYVYEGWYYLPNIVESGTALSIVYDDVGNTYLIPAPNVQVALDLIDAEFVKRDKYFTTQKHDNRLALVPIGNDLNTIVGTGFYLADKSTWGPDSDPILGTPGTDTFSIIHVALTAGVFVQTAVSITDASTYTRRFNGGAWGPWKANMTEQDVIDYVASAAPDGTWVWDGVTLAITIPAP